MNKILCFVSIILPKDDVSFSFPLCYFIALVLPFRTFAPSDGTCTARGKATAHGAC